MAVALHKRTGWPLAVVIGTHATRTESAYEIAHAVVIPEAPWNRDKSIVADARGLQWASAVVQDCCFDWPVVSAAIERRSTQHLMQEMFIRPEEIEAAQGFLRDRPQRFVFESPGA
jgi:hypothetical protein